jgi:hypothetical protein
VRQPLAEGGLARAAQAEQRDARALRVRGVLAHQQLDRHLHRVRQLAQQQDGNVALARFELREVALGDARGEGQCLARHAVLGAPGAHALTHAGEVRGFGVVAALRRGKRGAHMQYSA